MSNSIWKTGYPTYSPDRCGDDIVQEYYREDGSKFYVVGDCSEPNGRWAYLTDIIAQADKVERLQKAVDIAEEALKYARQRGLDNTATLFAVGTKADEALIKIKQLTQGTTNETDR